MADKLFLEVTIKGQRRCLGLAHILHVTETSTGKASIFMSRWSGSGDESIVLEQSYDDVMRALKGTTLRL